MNLSEYNDIAIKIKDIYREIDEKMSIYLKENNIGCSSCCGGCCCNSTTVEVSPIDLIPLALSLINSEKEILDKINQNLDKPCMFWIGQKCTVYENRAILCRMFGVCSVYNKEHKESISICEYINKKELSNYPPNIVDYSSKITNLVPSWDSRTRPFNESLKYAIEKILNSVSYEL